MMKIIVRVIFERMGKDQKQWNAFNPLAFTSEGWPHEKMRGINFEKTAWS